MANVLVFSTWQLTKPPHFETDLEIIQDHLEKGDRVSFVGCNGELPACDTNPSHDRARCLYCVGRREAGLGLLTERPEFLPVLALTEADRTELASLETRFEDIEDLQRLRVDDFDLGTAVLSTLLSRLRDHRPDLRKHTALIRNLLLASLATFRSVQNLLRKGEYDAVYVFNVRFAVTRAVFRACQSMNVDCLTHDRGHDIHHYTVRKNVMLHDLEYMKRALHEIWDAGDPVERERRAIVWFEDRAGGKAQAWRSFVADQQADLLPAGFRDDEYNVSLFVSSEDEFASIGEQWRNPIYADQLDGIRRIVDSAGAIERAHVYLRVHPNLAGLDNEQTRGIASLGAPHLTVIPADSSVSTYLLMRRSAKVVTFGSTIGIEAVFWGVPSILAGPSFYRALGGTYNPANHEDLMALIEDRDLCPGPREAALIYGYYLNTFGLPFKRYRATGIFVGRYNGRRVRPSLAACASIAALMIVPPLRSALGRRSLRRALADLIGRSGSDQDGGS